MLTSLKSAYGAGWRAGMCNVAHYKPLPGGLKRLANGEEICTIPPRCWIRRTLWLQGYHNGLYQRLSSTPTKGL